MKTYTAKANAKRAAKALAEKFMCITGYDVEPEGKGFRICFELDCNEIPEELLIHECSVPSDQVETDLPITDVTGGINPEEVFGTVEEVLGTVDSGNGDQIPATQDCDKPVDAAEQLAQINAELNGETAPALAPAIRRQSEIQNPCTLVWDIADRMKGARRKDVVNQCVAEGVAFYTARTQFQAWFKAQKAS